ncbi:MAG: PfkB family carbohydrate kinase [Chitinispirillales bacterium]|jgi:2-dehydro-3-deoxygluconokinase|nr:PfkB family carbohydrate kinase [Chitinispirillales bacterium]
MIPIPQKDYDLLVIGECFVEFACENDVVKNNSFQKDIGGADIVVAAAAARLGSGVQLISAIAHDPFYSFIRNQLTSQGINTDHVIPCQGYNGLYFTSNSHPESREYLIHHPGTANRHIKPSRTYDDLVEKSKIVYASSELQSVSKATRHTVFQAFHFAHCNNTMVAYDPNLRLNRWESLDDARECLWSVLPLVDVIFLSSPEESKALFGHDKPWEVIGFLWDRGVDIVVVKMGSCGCMVGYEGKIREFPVPDIDQSFTSPTLVGSAFNGGFLHSIAAGYDAFESAELANSVALYKGIKGGGIDSLPTSHELKIG